MSAEVSPNGKIIILDWEGTIGQRGGGLIPGAKTTLELLKQNGFHLAIATSMGTKSINILVDEHDLRTLFCHIQTSEMGYPKPDPEMLAEVLLATGYTANDAVMVGDCNYDLLMAQEAKVKPIGVLTGNDNEERLIAEVEGATVLESINELPGYFNITSTCH